jgi:uncharacterized protein
MEPGIIILIILSALLVIVGMAGLILPILPGPPLILAGLVMAAWAEGFEHVGAYTIIVLAIMAAFASLIDLAAGAWGARHFGASRNAVIGAIAGIFVGLFFGIPGIIFGPFIGAVIGELSARRTLQEAGFAGVGTWLGLAVGAAAKVAVGIAMIGIFLLVRFL